MAGLRANLGQRVDRIGTTINGWGALPTNPQEFIDLEPFFGDAVLVKIGNQIMVRTQNGGDLSITFNELIGDEGRIGIGEGFLNELENRLPIFKEILDEVVMDPSDDKTYVRAEIARERGVQEVKEILGWTGPSRERRGFTWSRMVNGTILTVAYFKDSITRECVTRGLIVPPPPEPQWLIKEGRKCEWQLRPEDRERLFSDGFVDTDFGAMEVIDEDISTPEKMAAYLARTHLLL